MGDPTADALDGKGSGITSHLELQDSPSTASALMAWLLDHAAFKFCVFLHTLTYTKRELDPLSNGSQILQLQGISGRLIQSFYFVD